MTDQEKNTGDVQPDTNEREDATSEKKDKELLIPKGRLDAEIAKKNEYKTKLEELLAEKEKEREVALKEQGKYKELAETNLSKAKQVDELMKWIDEQVEEEKKAIPEDKLGLIPDDLKGRQFLSYIRKPAVREMLYGATRKSPVDKSPNPDNQKGDGSDKYTWSYLNSPSFQPEWVKLTPEEQMKLRNIARQNALKGLK